MLKVANSGQPRNTPILFTFRSAFNLGCLENMDGISADNALLREILEERYMAFFGQTEGFNDTRRTEGETLARVPVAPNAGSKLPQRFLYPTTEIDQNPNVHQAGARFL